jgi:hypothetical protein
MSLEKLAFQRRIKEFARKRSFLFSLPRKVCRTGGDSMRAKQSINSHAGKETQNRKKN